MTELHPHWATNDSEPALPAHRSPSALGGRNEGGEIAKKPALTAATRIPVGPQSISRKPAAVLGIITVLVAGLSFFDVFPETNGTQTAQTSPSNAVSIRITEAGLIPKAANVRPGQEITWINEDTIPHILESDTLMGSNGTTLYTPAIFPGSEERFVLSLSQAAGRHSYISTTSVDIYGEINVLAEDGSTAKGAAPATTSQETADDESIFGTLPAGTTSGVAPAKTAQSSSVKQSQVITPDDREETIDSSDPLGPLTADVSAGTSAVDPVGQQNALIPYNPYTVGSTRDHPFDASGEPVDETHTGAPLKGFKNVKGFKPFTQPKTGPGLWIAIVLSVVTVAFVTRKVLVRAQR